MTRGRLNVVLVLTGLSFWSGCAMNGLKMPFRDTLASLDFRKRDPKSASESELSPEFREAQKVFKKDPEGTLLAWARWQEDVGEFGEARRKYRELLIAYPDNIEAQLGLARIELACGRVEQAEEILTKVAKQRPTNAPVRLELGRLYTQQEDWQKAIAAFEDASSMDRENQVCRYELGIAFARSHRYDQALSHLTYAVGESAANYNIGYVLHEQGNDAEAAEWFQNALQSHPDASTAEKTQAMLAQLSPKNSRDRSSTLTYPSADPSIQAMTQQSKPTAIDQFEPASFETPGVHAASTSRNQPSGQVLPCESRAANTQVHSQPSSRLVPSLLVPVTQQPVPVTQQPVTQQPTEYGMARQLTQPTANTDGGNPFQTVSHAVPQQQAGQLAKPGNQLPYWRGVSPQTISPQTISPQTISPQTISPQTISPQATSPQATSPQATSPQATSPQTTVTPSQGTPPEKWRGM